jgi:hypothetical protein
MTGKKKKKERKRKNKDKKKTDNTSASEVMEQLELSGISAGL